MGNSYGRRATRPVQVEPGDVHVVLRWNDRAKAWDIRGVRSGGGRLFLARAETTCEASEEFVEGVVRAVRTELESQLPF